MLTVRARIEDLDGTWADAGLQIIRKNGSVWADALATSVLDERSVAEDYKRAVTATVSGRSEPLRRRRSLKTQTPYP